VAHHSAEGEAFAEELFEVLYDDGDREDLTRAELVKLLANPPPETKKRGRNTSTGSLNRVQTAQAERKRKPHVGPKYSRFVGVTGGSSSHSSPTCWTAQIVVDGRSVHLGTFAAEEDAARAYNAHAARLGRPINAGLPPAPAVAAAAAVPVLWTAEEDQHLVDLVGSEDPAARFSFPGKSRAGLVDRWKELHIRVKATPAAERTAQEAQWLETLVLAAPGKIFPRMKVSQLRCKLPTVRRAGATRCKAFLQGPAGHNVLCFSGVSASGWAVGRIIPLSGS
jgi:hypothetical protein